MKTKQADAISYKIIQKIQITKEDSDFLERYNLEKHLLILKIE